MQWLTAPWLQNNEPEALRSWKTALDHIYYHNAHRGPSQARPTSETEKALVESLRQLELQCKERVDLLEALKRSRNDADAQEGQQTAAPPGAHAPTPTPPPGADGSGTPSWLGGGTVPPVDYAELSRPPLPVRPSLTPRKSSAPSLAPAAAGSHESRTPSPDKKDKKGRMLRTLRPGKDSRPSSTRLPASLRSRPPAAAKAATQAWGSKQAPGSSRLTKPPAVPSGAAGDSGAPARDPDRPLAAYRSGYPEPTPNARLLAASAAARSWTDLESGPTTPPAANPPQPYPNNARGRRSEEQPEPLSLEADHNEHKTRPPPRRKSKAKGETARAHLPPTPTLDPGDLDASDAESDEWKERVRGILKNLPRGVDEAAAGQILNEIVIQGDEVHWDDVAGLEVAKSALKETVVYPFLRPDLFMGLREPARGMLLFGPPGTGKTMLARAVATESKSTFFAISASSLTSKFLGESEKLVRALFALAKMLAPSIIFVDEIDSLLSSRSGTGEHEATRRIKTEFLIQWSDLAKAAAGREQTDKEKEKGDASRVLVLAATNLPWAIDEAARRRFVRRQYIPLPDGPVRKSQIKTLLSHQKYELSEAELDQLVLLTEGR